MTCTEDGPAPIVALGAGCIRAVVHPLEAGHLDVTVQRGEDSWSGALLLVAGDVAILDVEALLRLAARTRVTRAPALEFDVLAFYDKLAGRAPGVDQANYCRRVLAGMGDTDDRVLVEEACDRAATRAAEEAAEDEATEDLIGDSELEAGLEEAETDPTLVLLYHPDGRLRLEPRGSIPRRIATIATLSGVGASIGAALYWEVQAKRTYLDFPAMSEQLFLTKQNDRNRDVAVGVGVALTSTAFVFLAHQLAERDAFLRAKAAAESGAKLKGTE